MKQRLLLLLFLTAVATATATLNTAYANGEAVLTKELFKPGTILVRTKERALYYVTGAGRAIRYPVGVGRSGKQWAGSAYITGSTNQPSSIGHFVSYGCIRMFNEDIQDLYQRISVGTQVIVQ